jgi:hypothetical protein
MTVAVRRYTFKRIPRGAHKRPDTDRCFRHCLSPAALVLFDKPWHASLPLRGSVTHDGNARVYGAVRICGDEGVARKVLIRDNARGAMLPRGQVVTGLKFCLWNPRHLYASFRLCFCR